MYVCFKLKFIAKLTSASNLRCALYHKQGEDTRYITFSAVADSQINAYAD